MSDKIYGGGSLLWASFKLPWPLVTLKINQDEIVYSILFIPLHFKKEKIKSLNISPFLGNQTLNIWHTYQKYPEELDFMPLDYERMYKTLKECGYDPIYKSEFGFIGTEGKHSKVGLLLLSTIEIGCLIVALIWFLISLK